MSILFLESPVTLDGENKIIFKALTPKNTPVLYPKKSLPSTPGYTISTNRCDLNARPYEKLNSDLNVPRILRNLNQNVLDLFGTHMVVVNTQKFTVKKKTNKKIK